MPTVTSDSSVDAIALSNAGSPDGAAELVKDLSLLNIFANILVRLLLL